LVDFAEARAALEDEDAVDMPGRSAGSVLLLDDEGESGVPVTVEEATLLASLNLSAYEPKALNTDGGEVTGCDGDMCGSRRGV
jgi:hypothetical protein